MIQNHYTLFIRIPVYFTSKEEVLTDELWAKDLALHLQYIENFSLCCPVLDTALDPGGLVKVAGLPSSRVIPLRRDGGWGSVFLNILPNFWQVARALASTKIAHSGGAGWAFPLSFYILFLRPFFRFKWIVVIESSFWMKPTDRRPSPREWTRHYVYKILLGLCLRSANARIFTHDRYREYFKISKEATLVAPAVWVDETQIVSHEDHENRLAAMPDDEVRLLFPARLIRDKGVDIVLEAVGKTELLLQSSARASKNITLCIAGTGPLLDECESFAKNHRGRIHVGVHTPVAYGDTFFDLIRQYHAVLLANRQNEQPRIVFDAFSQGVPVISSATQGVSGIVCDSQNGLLYAVNDSAELAEVIVRFSSDLTFRRHLTRNALVSAKGHSHLRMHQTREIFLRNTLNL